MVFKMETLINGYKSNALSNLDESHFSSKYSNNILNKYFENFLWIWLT
jgi:hypothetical protein